MQKKDLRRKFKLMTIKENRIIQNVKTKERFLRIHITNIKGEFEAKSVHKGARILTSLVESNGYTIVHPGKELQKGTNVKVISYGKNEFAHLTPSM